MVAETLGEGKAASEIDATAVERAASQVIGRSLGIDDDLVRGALDAWRNVLGKRTAGSPHPDEVRKMKDRARRSLAGEESWLVARREHLAMADQRLAGAVEEYLA